MGYILIASILVCWLLFKFTLSGYDANLAMIHSQLGWIAVILLLIAAELSFRLKIQNDNLKEMIKEQKEIANILRIGLSQNNDKKINPAE